MEGVVGEAWWLGVGDVMDEAEGWGGELIRRSFWVATSDK